MSRPKKAFQSARTRPAKYRTGSRSRPSRRKRPSSSASHRTPCDAPRRHPPGHCPGEIVVVVGDVGGSGQFGAVAEGVLGRPVVEIGGEAKAGRAASDRASKVGFGRMLGAALSDCVWTGQQRPQGPKLSQGRAGRSARPPAFRVWAVWRQCEHLRHLNRGLVPIGYLRRRAQRVQRRPLVAPPARAAQGDQFPR